MKKLTITIALMLVVALAMPAFGASFSDVPSDHWSYNAINKLVAAGIVEGYPDGEFKGEQSMTRYEMAVMVSRALDNIVDEMGAMGEGLTTGQAEDVTAIVKSLMEKNTNDELSDAQAEEVADIVDALTFELRSELKVLGAEVDTLGKDVDELAAKVEAMEVPEDNIEFGMDIVTKAEVAYYGEDEMEERAVLELLQDGDAIDEDFTDDPDLFPAQERFWQEYNFNIAGELKGAEFNLAVDTITNLFMDERSVLDYTENDDNAFEMDTALLEVSFDNADLKIGDMPDYYPETYFLDEDFEGVEVNTTMYNTDFKAFAGGNDEDNLNNSNTAEMADEKYFGLTAHRDTELGILSGKIYHARSVVDGLADTAKDNGNSTRKGDGTPYDNTLVALGLENQITEALNLDGEIVYGQYEDENENDDSDMFINIKADYTVSEIFNTYAIVEYAGEDFVAARNDLEEAFGDYTKAEIGADYQLNDNNNINGFVTFAEAGDNWEAIKGAGNSDDKMVVNIGLDNVYGQYTNRAFVEYADGDGFEKNHEYTLVGLATDYEYDETMTMGAALNYKTIEKGYDNQEDFRDYVYLTGYIDKQLKENVSWLTEAMVIDGTTDYTRDADYYNASNNEVRSGSSTGSLSDANYIPDYGTGDRDDVDGTGYALTTSLSVSF
ncbi:S-layer domain protein domain protein [Halanaerobium saccharolyticum subsp. saccharolyticum DSM 6643]|uniref:S-layer domain protein domain protein n=1 Tax=Halanaerobium saccharolyticum subsp. saccharolyticum DSM 6643 TaxID=1293054 RepID=M5E1K0_9FIRM|nr:S-layer homology domain-containing protein [Halanaerobium saccharolyticum]CCU80184.1 S-layer domain protein domain protein [Halanaerobium saccharolyticum subsp. saccharolyticum DSM 6643]